jgi:hypothetical protein
MKKWIVVIVVVLAFVFVYVFIPNVVSQNKVVIVNNNYDGVYRALSDTNDWYKWWPEKQQDKTGSLAYNGNQYHVSNISSNSILLNIDHPNFIANGKFFLTPGVDGSLKLNWAGLVPTSYNPIKRLSRFFGATSLENDVQQLLTKMQTFYSDTTNLYNLKIKRDLVKDSLLVYTYDSIQGYPSTEKIYSLIDQLRNYINKNGAAVTDSPMLNISTLDSKWYLTKVAIPTDKSLPSAGKITFKMMLGRGNILTAEVVGSTMKVDSAFRSMQNYIQDFELDAPAIPYYSLLTNRQAQRDSTKWRTTIYYPVLYYKH